MQNFVSVRCTYCNGTGRDPGVSWNSKCVVCGGRGKNSVSEPYEVCAACDGTGRHLDTSVRCGVCRGKGAMPVRTSPTRR